MRRKASKSKSDELSAQRKDLLEMGDECFQVKFANKEESKEGSLSTPYFQQEQGQKICTDEQNDRGEDDNEKIKNDWPIKEDSKIAEMNDKKRETELENVAPIPREEEFVMLEDVAQRRPQNLNETKKADNSQQNDYSVREDVMDEVDQDNEGQ